MQYDGIPVVFATSDALTPAKGAPLPTAAVRALDRVAITSPAYLEGPGYELVPKAGKLHPIDPQASLVGDYRLSAAALLYAAQCLKIGNDAEKCPMLVTSGAQVNASTCAAYAVDARTWDQLVLFKDLCRLRWNSDFRFPVVVRWGLGVNRPSPAKMAEKRFEFEAMLWRLHGDATQPCRPTFPGFMHRIGRLAREAFPVFAPEYSTPLCRYVQAVPYLDFSGAITNADKKLILQDRIVMFGGQYQTTGDWVPSLVDNVPGVHYHAMALTNLIDKGADYPRVELPVRKGSAFSLEAWPSFVAIWLANIMGGIAIMTLNEPALDPAGASVHAPHRRMSAWQRSLRRGEVRVALRVAIVVVPFAILLAAFVLLMEPVFALNLTVIMAVLAIIGLKLSFHAAKPWLKALRPVIHFFEVSNGRMTGPDIDQPISGSPKGSSSSRGKEKQ